jgi:hypothetical protein
VHQRIAGTSWRPLLDCPSFGFLPPCRYHWGFEPLKRPIERMRDNSCPRDAAGQESFNYVYNLSFILIFNDPNYKRVPFMSQVVRRRHSADSARRPLDPEGWRIHAFAVQAVTLRAHGAIYGRAGRGS